MKKRLLSILLTACMVLTLLPTVALAATGSGTFGAFTVTYDGDTPTYSSPILTLGNGSYTISSTITSDRISVAYGKTANVTLNGVSIDVSGTNYAYALQICNTSVVHLTLADGTTNTLIGGASKAGLYVQNSATVIIDGNGRLNATGGDYGAGIGGGGDSNGIVTINSGTINAVGGKYSAGIGGGGNGAQGGKITISGGTITAKSGAGGAGIGGGLDGYSGEIIINGNANVTASVTNFEGAGIGSSGNKTCGTITIGGSAVVKATGGSISGCNGGAGIGGGGKSAPGGSITIDSTATVVAISTGTQEAIDSTATTTISGNILMANYSASVAANTETTVKNGWGVALATPITVTPTADYTSVAFSVPGAAEYTLYQSSARQKGTQSGVTSPLFIVGAGLNTFTAVTTDEPTYAAAVTINKEGNPWTGSGKSIALYQSGTKKYNMTVSGETASVSAAEGSYDIFEGISDTGVNISVNSGGGNAMVNYYTLTLVAGAGTASPTGGGVYLPGKSVAVDAAVSTGYAWSKWASSNIGLLLDQATQSTSIATPASAITLTATATPIQYTVTYTLNGGTVSPENPTGYTIETSTFTLNNLARSGYSFLGWTGSNGTTVQTNVNIPKGSTGNKSYTANWKADKPTSAPDASIVTAKTDTSLTITTQDGYEYSVDGTNWYSGTSGSYTFTGLAPNTAYSLVCRKAAVSTGDISSASDASGALSISTKTASASVSVPDAPAIGTGTDIPTSGSITINTAAGNEYYISTSAAADWSGTPSGYFKAPANGTHKFNSLSPATQYYIHVRVAETENAMPSASSSVSQYTLPETPAAGTGYSINYATEKITVTGGYEVNTSESFGAGTAITSSLNPNTTYYVRVAANGGTPASEAVSFPTPARPATPTAITADKTKNSITITPVAGQEYKIGSGAWQDSGSFSGLSAGTDYTVYTRVKAVSSGSVSFASEAYSATIKTKTDGSSGFTLPTISVSPTYAPGKTLADISLPTSWAWSAPTTVPTVLNTGYGAVYSPTDADTIDYSGVVGYAVDGGGKVTITRVVHLTVNRAAPTAADFTYTTPASLDYSGTAKTATVAVKGVISGMGAVTVKYYDKDGAVVDAPTNAGTYTVKISLEQGNNYAAVTELTDSAWTFTIAKAAQAPLSITKKPASIIYGDTFTLETTGGNGTGAVTWSLAPGGSATVDDLTGFVTITGVVETTITVTKATDGNYSADVTDTYTFTPATRLIKVDAPSATGGWTKTYDGKTAFDKSIITFGGITNKVGSDAVNVSVQSATYDTADVGSGNRELTITYAIDGTDSGNYSVPSNTVISTASITAATPAITIKNKAESYTGKKIEIDAATVKGVTGGTTPDGAITYTYYTKDTCTDADKTSVGMSGADAIGGAPKSGGTYYVKATIAASGNYTAATSVAVTLAIYYPYIGEVKSSAPVIVDGKIVDMGTFEVKDKTTTVTVDQNKMTEQLKSAKDSVVIPVTSKTDTAAAQLMVQNVEDMAKKGMTLTVQAEDVNYSLPANAVDTAALLTGLDASDSTKVTFTVTMAELSKTAVTIKDGTLMVAPMQFTVTAAYNGKSVNVENFESYVQREIELPSSVDPKTITTAVVVEANGTERHVPTEVYSRGGKWYAKINSMTNSTYALIQSNTSFTDTTGKWYDAVVTEMASRKIISGIGENMFAGDQNITRAEFAAILVRALGLPANGTSIFSDVPASAWYSGAVATAVQYGLVAGKGDNRFAPDAYITRQEAIIMLQRAAKLTDYTGTTGSLEGFTDAGSVGTWAQDAAKWNVGSGLIVGSGGLLRPNDNISRAESAVIILRLLQKTGLVDVRSEA